MSSRAQSWYRRQTFAHAEFPAARLAAQREASVSICLPARNEARTIGAILEQLMPLLEVGVADEVLVVDNSTDGTAEIARGLGAEVCGQTVFPDGGGRVTELTARPLLNLFYPELAGFGQPLAGEVAARRDLLEQLPFVAGYGVDIGLLLDAYREAGLWARAQVDLDVRQNAHQTLRALGPMAYEVLHAVAARLAGEGRLDGPLSAEFAFPGEGVPQMRDAEFVERPPVASLRAAA
jgi:hypothetical protein